MKAKLKQTDLIKVNVNAKQEKGSETAAHLGDFSITELHTYKEFKIKEESECGQN